MLKRGQKQGAMFCHRQNVAFLAKWAIKALVITDMSLVII
jgi:hypothetical protein